MHREYKKTLATLFTCVFSHIIPLLTSGFIYKVMHLSQIYTEERGYISLKFTIFFKHLPPTQETSRLFQRPR